MEIVAVLNDPSSIRKLKVAGAEGVIFGGILSLRFSHSLSEIREISDTCREYGLKRYVSIDAMVPEKDKTMLYEYMEFLRELDVDGIYFTDLCVLTCARSFDMQNRLIYDPDTLLSNSLDTSFYIGSGMGAVLARELTLDEITKILSAFPGKVDLQVFGHLKMSYSKRHFLKNYFEHIGKPFEGGKELRLVEESRNYALPVVDDEYGTRIYSDYVLMMYKELSDLKPLIRRAIVDGSFLENEVLYTALRDIRSLNSDNADQIAEAFAERYPELSLSSAYLYRKTTKVKEDE